MPNRLGIYNEVVVMAARGKYEYWLTDDGLTLLKGWARNGLTDEQIAHNCGITAKTLYEWKNKFSEISEALKKGKEIVDIQVENALLKRALGYSYDEVMEEESDDGVKHRVTKKFIPPDVTAQIFWLKNRRPIQWRDKPTYDADKDTLQKLDALLGDFKNAVKQEAD